MSGYRDGQKGKNICVEKPQVREEERDGQEEKQERWEMDDGGSSVCNWNEFFFDGNIISLS